MGEHKSMSTLQQQTVNKVTQTEYAKMIGKSKPYVTKLKKQGRLVMQDNLVLVEESNRQIENTSDPSKTPEQHTEQHDETDQSYNYWRTKNEKKKYYDADRESKLREGELIEAKQAAKAIMESGTIIRNRLESLPDMLAPQLINEPDEAKIRAVLVDQIEWILTELSEKFKQLTENHV